METNTNFDKLEDLIEKFPKLPLVLRAGVLSRKTARTVLDLDKWQMDDLYIALIEGCIVQGVSSGTFRATQSTLQYLIERGY